LLRQASCYAIHPRDADSNDLIFLEYGKFECPELAEHLLLLKEIITAYPIPVSAPSQY